MDERQTGSFVDLVVIVGLLAFTSVYFSEALSLGALIRYGIPSASFLPVVLSLLMYGCLCVQGYLLLRRLWNSRRGKAIWADAASLGKPAIAAAITAVYIYVYARLGFQIATFLYVAGLLFHFGFAGERASLWARIGIILAFAAVASAIIYGFFVFLFGVQLPSSWM